MLIRHSVIYFLGRIIPGAVSLLSLALFTRLMNAEEYGQYALVITSVGIINAVFFQWLSISLGRFLPAHDHQPRVLISTSLVGYSVLVVITGALGSIVAWLWPEKTLRWIIVLTVVVAWSQAWFELNLRITNARLDPISYGLLSSVKAIITVSVGLLLFHLGFGVVGVLIGLITAQLLCPFFVSRYWHGFSVQHYNSQLLKSFIWYGAPLTLTFLLILVIDVSDRFLIGWLLNAKAVGIYVPAYDLAQQSLGMLMGVIYLAASPIVLKELEEKGIAAAQKQIQQNGLLLLLFSLPATVGLAMLAGNFVFVVMGAEFRDDARKIIPVIALAIFASGIRSFYFDYSFQLGKKLKGQTWAVLCGAITNIALNLWWIPQFGILGAAYATLAAFIVAMIVNIYLGRKVFPLPSPHRDLYKVVLATTIMGVSLYFIKDWRGIAALSAQIFVGVILYGVALIAFNVSEVKFKLFAHR